MGKGGGYSFRKGEGGKYGRRRAVDKITIRMSEKATRNHTINYLHKNSTTHRIQCINIHI